jgi:type III secretion system YopN/LcrE/InvE/MxiC family regulator
MQAGIEGHKMSVLAGFQSTHSALSSTVHGSYKGQSVALVPGGNGSAVEDSLEELTFTLSETGSKKLADRSTRSKSFAARLHALMAKYVTAMPKTLSPDELKHQYGEWLKKLSQPSVRDLKSRLEERFGDDGESQVATLEFLDELFTEEEDPAAKAVIRELKQQWRQDEKRGPLLRAGENISSATDEFAGELDTDCGLRSFYRTTVLSWSTLDDAYTSILGSYSGATFEAATDFLLTALGCEMQSLGPSCDLRLLAAVRDDIYYLQVVRRLHEQLEELVDRLKTNYGINLCNQRKPAKRRRRSSGKSSRSKTSAGSIRPPS